MNFAGLLFLLITHFFTGKGVVRLFRIQLQPVATLCFSMLCGVFVASLVPCIMQFAHVPLTVGNIYAWLGATAALFSIPLLVNIKNTKLPKIEWPQLYEIPFILVFLTLTVISVWRCYYLPVTPRDMLTGPELLAEFAVREKTMLSSVFGIDLRMHMNSANNVFKSPFITCLQIIYKLLVHPFGQQWLSVVFISFSLWLYVMIRERIHPLLAGVIMLVFFTMPDVFAYSYLILYDYSNMAFFFAGYFFLARYLQTKSLNELVWASFLLGVSTYIRTETLIIIGGVMAPLLAIYYLRSKEPLKKAALGLGLVVSVPFLFNFLCTNIFVKHFVPLDYNLGALLNHNLLDVSLLFDRLGDIVTKLMFNKKAEAVYAHFFIVFFAMLVIDVLWPRKYNTEARMALWGSLIVYVGLALVAYVIPLTTVENTLKRGLFKILPMMIWYLANSGLLQKISDFIKNREYGKKEEKPAPQLRTAPVARPAAQQPKPLPPKPKK